MGPFVIMDLIGMQTMHNVAALWADKLQDPQMAKRAAFFQTYIDKGEGFYKKSLPDAHSDFVFAVAAEEYGALICSVIIIIYGLIIIRSFYYTMYNNNLFFILAVGGLAFQLGFQSLIHMASNTDLIPTKGMTLPFLSYGGSSLLASAITAGIILSLTKRSNPLDPFRKEIYDK